MMSKELDDAGRPRQVNPCRDFGFIFIYTDMLDSLERWRDRSLWLLSGKYTVERGGVGAGHHQKVPVEVQTRNHGGLDRTGDSGTEQKQILDVSGG